MPNRRSPAPAAPHRGGYLSLLRAAEANPDEVFTIPGETLAILLREIEHPRRAVRKSRIQAA